MMRMFYKFLYNKTQNTNNDPNQNNTNNNPNQNNTSTLSTTNTNITRTQQLSPRNYDPPPLPSQYSTQKSPNNSPQQGSSNTHGTNAPQIQPTVQFQTTTPTRQPILQTLAYTPAQNTKTHNIQPGLTINTLHSNTLSYHFFSRSLSRPPLQPIPINP